MPRKRRQEKKPPEPSWKLDEAPLAHQPFQALNSLNVLINEPAVEPEPQPPAVARPQEDVNLFRSAMSDVTPHGLEKKNGSRPCPPQCPPQGLVYSEDLESLAKLEDLVAGRTVFDLVDSDEYLEGYIRGIHPIILEKLRQGYYSVQAHLDLHGLTVREAEEAVREFIGEAVGLGYRCVLLVHGRGLNSKDQIPVLKRRLEKILLRGPVRKKILAFASARPHDGGAGASYVLLRAKF